MIIDRMDQNRSVQKKTERMACRVKEGKSMHLSMETCIQTTQAHLFDCLETEGQLKKWVPRLIRITYKEMPKTGDWKGASFILHFRGGKKEQEVHGEVVAYRKPELLGIRLFFAHTILDVFFNIQQEEEGQLQITCDCEISIGEKGNRLKARLDAWQIRRAFSAYLRHLKNRAENYPLSA
jgi:uncharacterized protein YndB with AHSA1/START domain